MKKWAAAAVISFSVTLLFIGAIAAIRTALDRMAQREVAERAVEGHRVLERAELQKRESDREVLAKIAAAERARRGSFLRSPNDKEAAIPLAPTRDGLTDFISASQSGSRRALLMSAQENDIFTVPAGTRCQILDLGFSITQVRITSGPDAGRKGFAVTEFIER